MSTPAENSPLTPSLIAAKLARIQNFEDEELLAEVTAEPRLLEIPWFLQYMSHPDNHPGGLRKFVADLIADSRDIIGTFSMQEHTGERLSEAALIAVEKELPTSTYWACLDGIGITSVAQIWDDENTPTEEEFNRQREVRLAAIKRSDLVDACCAEAQKDLMPYLHLLCEQMPYRFRRSCPSRRSAIRGYGSGERACYAPWYFARMAEAILRFMDRRKAQIGATIASTAVSQEVFHWLHKARVTRSAVIIEGNSRFGKTESVKTWAAMHSGLARYVKTPPSTSEGDLLRAVASALGIADGYTLRTHRLRTEIEYVLKHSGLMLIFDEAQSMFPSSFGRNTAPARLNWVRCNVLDSGLPAAFVATPQSYRHAERKYTKATGFAIEQWSERILKTVHLPTDVTRDDLYAIARIHFPGLSDSYLAYVVERAHGTERNYVSDVSKIARLAYSNAADAGLPKPKLDHIIAAINDVLPTLPVVPAPTPPPPTPARLVKASCKRPTTPLQRRSIRPAPAPLEPPFDRTLDASAEVLLPG